MSNSDSDLVVAIWMVTYNHENYIEQAIESVMMQKTTFNYKLIIGEDCSTDSTRAICLKLKGKYPDKIELQLNEENLGHDKNGLVVYDLCYKSKATYIAMLEGDDYWMDPLKLQKQIDFLEDNVDYSLSFTRFKVKEDDDRSLKNDKIGHYFKNDETSIIFDFKKFETGWYGGLPTLVFRAKSFNLKLTLKYSYFRDVHLFTELLKKGKG
ncbi:MAG: glycosyltransferase, partial [Nitrosopumilus sp.]|nr:glycosyltransferase [Nitrosopumilus sp.]